MTTQKRRAIFTCLTLHRTTGIAGALAAAAFITLLPAAADPAPNPAHTIANRFAEDAQRAEAAREARRKEAARRQAQERAAKAAKEKSQKAHEAEMLTRARAESEERRQLEIEAARLDALRAAREAQQAEAERQQAEKARIAAEESRRAEQAKQAAEAQRVAAERAAAEEARKADEARRIEMARKAEEAARLAETERLAEEARRTEQAAWAAEEAKRVAEIRKAEDVRKAEEGRKAEQIRKANEALRLAAEEAARAEADRLAEDARRIADREADAEIERVADRLSRIREEHLARHTGPALPVAGSTTRPTTQEAAERTHEPSSGRGRIAENEGFRDVPLAPPRTRHGAEPRAPEADHPPRHAFDGRVTVLLQMEPRYRRGRRYESMDPVLCVAGGCYVSNGADQPATFLHGHRAVRFGNAISRRAGACNHAYTCVFRDVDLRVLPADVQPVDIRVLRHDRREPERVETLSNCRATAGDRLACTGAIHGDGYTMWVISESAAERLGPDALDGVLDGGFMNSAEADPKLNPWRERW